MAVCEAYVANSGRRKGGRAICGLPARHRLVHDAGRAGTVSSDLCDDHRVEYEVLAAGGRWEPIAASAETQGGAR